MEKTPIFFEKTFLFRQKKLYYDFMLTLKRILNLIISQKFLFKFRQIVA